MKGKKILIGVSGSIAVYKSLLLVRLFVQAGAIVKVIMTEAATKFVAPLSFSTLSKNPVYVHLMDDDTWNNHVELGRWADLFIIAPLTCNTLAKMSTGICDNMLLAVYLSATCPVLAIPAMDEDMWLHSSTRNNLNAIKKIGNKVISVNTGELASGLIGPGRMAEPKEIFEWVENLFSEHQLLQGKKVVITAGPTHEPIDPVRFIGNRSSGKMGIAIAECCIALGAEVTLVLGPVNVTVPQNCEVLHVQTAREMYNTVVAKWPASDIGIMAAAVADYTIPLIADEKIKKQGDSLSIELVKTLDILATLGSQKRKNQFLVGFALETNNEEAFAKGKLKNKNADIIVLNSLREAGAGFGHDSNKITIFGNNNYEQKFDLKSKSEVARDIIDTIVKFYND